MNGKRIPVYMKKGLHPYGMQPQFVTSELGFEAPLVYMRVIGDVHITYNVWRVATI